MKRQEGDCTFCTKEGITTISFFDKLMRKFLVSKYCKDHELEAITNILKDKGYEMISVKRDVKIPKSLEHKLQNLHG